MRLWLDSSLAEYECTLFDNRFYWRLTISKTYKKFHRTGNWKHDPWRHRHLLENFWTTWFVRNKCVKCRNKWLFISKDCNNALTWQSVNAEIIGKLHIWAKQQQMKLWCQKSNSFSFLKLRWNKVLAEKLNNETFEIMWPFEESKHQYNCSINTSVDLSPRTRKKFYAFRMSSLCLHTSEFRNQEQKKKDKVVIQF